MMKKIRRSISSLTLRAFCRNTSNHGTSIQKGGWFFQKRQESCTLTQSDPSMDDGFNIAAFYFERQLDFPNQVPGNVLQLYHELYDMERKVRALENEISGSITAERCKEQVVQLCYLQNTVYVMSFQNQSPPETRKGGIPMRRKLNNVKKKCCIPGLWNCARPAPVMSETYQRSGTISRPVNGRASNEGNSVSTAVQTTNLDSQGSRLSKVSWNSKVDVRYIGSESQSEISEKAPLQGAGLHHKANEDMRNVVHLKIKIPKDVLNLKNREDGKVSKRLENGWNRFSSTLENMNDEKTYSANRDVAESVPSYPNKNRSQQLKSNYEASNLEQTKLEEVRENRHSIVGTSVVQNVREESEQPVGIPIKRPGKSVCDSKGCACKGSTRNDKNLEKVRQSFDMTESELSLLEEAVHNNDPGPMELKIRTEYGSVNVISHDPDCKCKICETFGSHHESRGKRSGRSDSAAVISKKIIRVYYNGHYRNIITHTEECGCEICSNIEEHSYKLMSKRASIVSTHRGDLVVKNKGVCGCKNCKTVEMGPHVVNVGTVLSRTSSHVLDQCYYSDATIPSMQSFPKDGLTTTDDQGASFSSPPSINSSDLSDDMFRQSPSASNTSDQAGRMRPNVNITEIKHHIDEIATGTNMGKCTKRENSRNSRAATGRARNRIYNFFRPSSAKSSPAGLYKNKTDNDFDHCISRKNAKGKYKRDKHQPIPMESESATRENLPSIPLERDLVVDTEETFQPNITNVSSDHEKADTKISSYNAEHITLEDLIKDLIRGQPGMKKDKVYTVTLGEVANRPFTKIHIVDCSDKPGVAHKNEAITNDKQEPIKLPKGHETNSNVFFIKTVSSGTALSHIRRSGLPNFGDSQNIYASSNNQSLSSPACIQDGITEKKQSTRLVSLQEEGMIANKSEGTPKTSSGRRTSETSPASDVPKRAFKLTISFGKKVASLFKQRGKKKSTSHHRLLTGRDASQCNPKYLKTFTVYEGAEKHLKHMELLKFDVKPRCFTLEANSAGEEANSSFTLGPILCLVGKNSNTQVLATVPT